MLELRVRKQTERASGEWVLYQTIENLKAYFLQKYYQHFWSLFFVKEKLLKTYIWRTKQKLTYFGGLVSQIRG